MYGYENWYRDIQLDVQYTANKMWEYSNAPKISVAAWLDKTNNSPGFICHFGIFAFLFQ